MEKVVFLFDRVMHYHRDLFVTLDQELPKRGRQLVLLSGAERPSTTGRVALKEQVVPNQINFTLHEWKIRTFMVRFQQGVLGQLLRLRPAVVVTMCHSGTLSEWLILLLKPILGFRLVAWQCGYEYNPVGFKQRILGWFIPRFDHHLAYHTNAARYAIGHGAPESAVTVMHNTINEGKIVAGNKAMARDELNRRHPGLAGGKVILYVGAVLDEKRLEAVVDALDLAKRNEWRFLVVGDGPHLASLKSRCEGRSDVIFAGRVVEGVDVYFDGADVFVLPGTGGLAINEAMAHRLPVVAGYADGSTDDLVADGVTGFRLHRGDASELADRVGAILDDPARAERMGAEAEQRIRGHLSFNAFIARVVSVLER